MSNQDKTIVVFTATGAQGGSVVDALLEGGYKVIGLTRNVDGAGAKALKAKGVRVASADIADVNSYKETLKGAYGLFINADFWNIYATQNYDIDATTKEEFRQATEAMKAAKEAGVKHIVYSSLDDNTGCPHWQSKADASKWAYDNHIPFTNLIITAYFENITSFKLIQGPKEDGSYTFVLPLLDDTKYYGVPVAQTGLWVRQAFDNPDKWIGKDLYAVSGEETISEIAQIFSEISGKKVDSLHLTSEAFNSDGMKKQLGEEMWKNWRLFVEKRITRDVKASQALAPGAPDFRTWAKNDKGIKELLNF
ncbi:hypothetical protein I302_104867 [Kwoniella bestiolae CBS 10118]|uniref:NmrA-like domain-containing protein n=1 Tax=Kwoniella bestiolae CBS 10118 TaxID=1296100 RepID=A0A1B9FRJ9_9TREE|nr:hypothetical protein I302_09063 [Kwoniella bestiolae CBS 10118]OCF21386.1 hypothetical protein I302_09063 [Kwoniella bestiolae CBS 10118]